MIAFVQASSARKWLSAASTLACAIACVSGAQAQAQSVQGDAAVAPDQGQADAAAQESDIIVTGFRQSLGAAINLKRQSVSSVDAIVAEDIAKFPDQNLAESLQRIPGISIQRDGGEGRAQKSRARRGGHFACRD